MSDKCSSCDCNDPSKCVKKNRLDIIETDQSRIETVFMDASAAEHDGKCKCGASCACVDCTCGA